MPKIEQINNENQEDIIEEVKDWKSINEEFTPELQKEWEERGFSYEEAKHWIEDGLEIKDYEFACYLRQKNYNASELSLAQLLKLRKKYSSSKNWKDINNDFTTEFQKEWKDREINYEQTKGLMDIVLQVDDVDSAQKLRQECINSHLSKEAITQIKDFNFEKTYNFLTDKYNLPQEQQSLLEKLIPNEELRERYINYGLCPECQQPNTTKYLYKWGWCHPCNSKHFQQNFNKWTSGNPDIDKLIQKHQLEATSRWEVLEWIPYEEFTNIEYLASGGFGVVHKAFWNDGYIVKWNVKDNKWERYKSHPDGMIALKVLNDSQKITTDFLQEISCHRLLTDSYIVNCYGISQDSDRNYVMVMRYIFGGNLRWFLHKNKQLSFADKLIQLSTIINGLKTIHSQGLVHRDFHPGNILCNFLDTDDGSDNIINVPRGIFAQSYITDLGLSRPANENNDKKIYGVLPYVAPEVLSKKLYTQASDIYSFGIIMYKMLSGLPPYTVYDTKEEVYKELSYDTDLAIEICRGLRPSVENLEIPQLLKDLIKKCWDANPEQRPVSEELYNFFLCNNWVIDSRITTWEPLSCSTINKKNSEFYQQYKKIEEAGGFKKSSLATSSNKTLKTHPQTIYKSTLLDFPNLPEPQNSKEINKQYWNSANNSLFEVRTNDFTDDYKEKNSLQAQIEIPPKGK